MKRINTILKSSFVPPHCGRGWEWDLSPFSWKGLGVGILLLFVSCGNQAGSLADVAEDDSLYIDTVATLDEVIAPDTIALPDSLMKDSL